MERTGSFAYTRGVLRELTEKALVLVEEMEGGEAGGRGVGNGVRGILEMMRVESPVGGAEEVGAGPREK